MQAAGDVEVRRRKRGMPLDRLRRWLLGGVLVLASIIAGFIGYARQRTRKSLRELPHLLGADIRSVTDGFTYSQTVKGRTLFTIHAARAVQRENGKTTLHDVSVTLYGEPGTNRTDSIRGAEFEYDQPNGVIRAMGETQLDLASPAAGSAPQWNAKRMIVTASGLVFLEKLGVAATDEQVRFQYGTVRGQSLGADYDADTGLLHLHHSVHMESQENRHLEMVDSDDAVLDRMKRTALLHRASVVDASDRLRAQTLHIDLRPEGTDGAGSIQQMRGEGEIEIDGQNGTEMRGSGLVANFTEANRLSDARLSGGVTLAGARVHGSAGEAKALFDVLGRPSHVDVLHDVDFVTAGDVPFSTREISAEHLGADVVRDASQRARLQNVVATGGARLKIADPAKAGPVPAVIARHDIEQPEPGAQTGRGSQTGAAGRTNGIPQANGTPQANGILQANGAGQANGGMPTAARARMNSTVVTATVLRAFGSAGPQGRWELRRVEGDGATEVEQRLADGSQRLSSGDHLLALLSPQSGSSSTRALKHAGPSSGPGPEFLESVVQQGHVAIKEQRVGSPSRAGSSGPAAYATIWQNHATADRVEYSAATEEAVLTGSPVVNDPGMQVAADRIAVSRRTGDTEARGNVKGSYSAEESRGATALRESSPGSTTASRDAGPLHFVAERAILIDGRQTATLFGGHTFARLWNASGQLEAPVIDLLRSDGSVHAHSVGDVSSAHPMVRAVLPAGAAGAGHAAREGTGPLRILSNNAVYTRAATGAPAQARFSGGVQLLSADGTVLANQATAVFLPSPTEKAAALGAGAVQQVIAEGKVSVQQPGRLATGERLVYTAADQQYRLTGTPAAPPQVRDNLQGTITGTSLIFHPGDDSVEVAGAASKVVRTDAVVPERASSGEPKLTSPRKVPGGTP